MEEPFYLKLKDGTLIDTRTAQRVVSTEINKAFSDKPESSFLRPGVRRPNIDGISRRFIDDLPIGPNQSRAVAIVAAYSIFGLYALDISDILGIPVESVELIQDSTAYTKFIDAMLQNIREHDRDVIRKKINKNADKAVDKIIALSDSTDEAVALRAAKDILDRAENQRGQSLSESKSGLTIRIIDERDDPAANVEVSIDG